MKKKTFKFFILQLLLKSSFLLFPFTLFAQEESKLEPIAPSSKKTPVYKETALTLDLFQLGSYALGGDFLSTELGVEVSLKNRFFPILEVGFGTTNSTEDSYQMKYKSSAPYFRAGMNYNVMSKSGSRNYLYVGARYGFTAVTYDVYGPPMKDDVWGGELPFAYYGEKSHAHWGELLVGVKAHIYKNFQMGWSVRYKFRFSVKENFNTNPWYLPGYGKNNSTNLGIAYNLIYILPL